MILSYLKKKNILQIAINDIKKAENETFFLVQWLSYKDKIDEIIAIKKDSGTLIIYAPPVIDEQTKKDVGRIDDVTMRNINNARNTIVVNIRGRLLNDIVTCMITTSFK